MKRKLLVLTLLMCQNIFSQITLTAADIPSAGLRVINYNKNDLFGIPPGSSGENQTYEFSTFAAPIVDSTFYIETTQSPYASDFPNSNISMLQLPDTNYTFLNINANNVEVVGLIVPVDILFTKVTAKAVDNNGVIQVNYPINYNDELIDEGNYLTSTLPVEFGLPAGTIPFVDTAWIDSVRANVSVRRESKIDGWGTLTTPNGSFSVLRQKATDYTTINPEVHVWTTSILGTNALGYITPPFQIPGFSTGDTTTHYYYYTNATADRPSLIAYIQEDLLGQTSNEYYTWVYNPAGIIETDNSIITDVYPNPSANEISVKAKETIKTINIYSDDARLIYNRSLSDDLIKVNVEKFNSGVYFVEIHTESGRAVKRFVKK